ncbi:MAG: glycosyltransferase [Georgenia sp.]
MAAASHQPARPSTLAVVVSAGVSAYLPRTLAGIAGQRHVPDVVLVVDVGAPGREIGTGVPVHEAVTDAGLDAVTRVRVVRAAEATNFGDAVRAGLAEYTALVERAAEKARRRGWDGHGTAAHTTGSRSWSGVTGELNPVTAGEIRAVGAGDEAPDHDARAEWLWLLHDDSAPAPGALDELLHAAESGRSVALLGAKQRDWFDPAKLHQVGLSATRSARRLSDIEPGEIDQGQHDHREDVLAVGLAGALVRTSVWAQLNGTDPTLGPFGDGLELSRRVRLAGHRVVVVPTAVVHHARASYLGLRSKDPMPGAAPEPDPRRSFRARRRAQLHNALVAAPAGLVPLFVFGMALLAPLRALWRVATSELGLATAELAAPLEVLTHPGAVRRARGRISVARRVSPRALAPLQASGAQVRRLRHDLRLQDAAARRAAQAPSELEITERAALARRRRRTLSLVTLTLTAVGLVAYLPSFLDGSLRGGALLPADAGLADLWRAGRSGWIPAGAGSPGPADPWLQVLAVLLAPFAGLGASGNAVTAALTVLAFPLAGLGGWFAAGAATRSVLLRAFAALVWGLAPGLLLGTGQGRLGAVLAHLLLPWVALGIARAVGVERRDVILSGLVGARRTALARALDTGPAAPAAPAGPPGSLTAAAAAALALAAAATGAPVLLPAAVVTVLVLLLLVPRGRRRLLLVPVPALVVLGPLAVAALGEGAGSWRLLLADPGAPYPSAAGPAWLSVLGWPVTPPDLGLGTGLLGAFGRWGLLLGGAALVLVAAAALLRGTTRWRAVRAGWLVVAVGVVTALASARTDVAVGRALDGTTEIVRGWAGAGTSLVVLGLLMAVVAGGDGLQRSLATRSFGGAQVAVTAVSVLACVGLLLSTGGWLVAARSGQDRPSDVVAVHGSAAPAVPALAAEMQASGQRSRVLALTPAGGTVTAEVWRGPGPQLHLTSTVVASRELVGAPRATLAAGGDVAGAAGAPGATSPGTDVTPETELAGVVAALAVGGASDAAPRLGAHAIGVVIVPPEPTFVPAGTEPSTAERTALIAALDATAGLERVTQNASGVIWRVAYGTGDGAAPSVARARVLDAEGQWVQDVAAGVVSARDEVPAGAPGRTLVLAERADAGWRAWYDGRPLRAVAAGWRQAFELPAQAGTLTVGYQAPQGTVWGWGQAVVIGLTVLLALPLRRRRTEVE